jgi:hypothetical protein
MIAPAGGADRFPRPDWDAVYARIDPIEDDTAQFAAWVEAGRDWLKGIAAAVGDGFALHETRNFLILSNRTADQLGEISSVLERYRRDILEELEGLAQSDPRERLAVLWLEDDGMYYEYVSHFYPESGEFAMSSGMFITQGFPHFVFPHYDNFGSLEHIVAHELTHALLRHLPLPLWTNEGIATTLEDKLAGAWHSRFDPQILHRHQQYWNERSIQQFWSGESFQLPDEGNELSYALAQLLVVNLGHDFPRFRQFASAAQAADAGQEAARAAFGIGLGELLARWLGAGRWAPDPASWPAVHNQPE